MIWPRGHDFLHLREAMRKAEPVLSADLCGDAGRKPRWLPRGAACAQTAVLQTVSCTSFVRASMACVSSVFCCSSVLMSSVFFSV